MNNEQQILQELIAERKRIDELIKRYGGNDDTPRQSSEVNFSDLIDPSLNSQHIDCSPHSTGNVATVTTTNVTINNDYSVNYVENNIHTHHTNTNVSLGDTAVSVVGGLLRNLFE